MSAQCSLVPPPDFILPPVLVLTRRAVLKASIWDVWSMGYFYRVKSGIQQFSRAAMKSLQCYLIWKNFTILPISVPSSLHASIHPWPTPKKFEVNGLSCACGDQVLRQAGHLQCTNMAYIEKRFNYCYAIRAYQWTSTQGGFPQSIYALRWSTEDALFESLKVWVNKLDLSN